MKAGPFTPTAFTRCIDGFSRRMLFIVSAAVVSGCTTAHRVTVDSLAKPDANAISYSIRTSDPSIEQDTLRFREASDLVRTALSGRGLYEAPPGVVPDVIVDIDYGISEPKVHRERRTVPIRETDMGTWKTNSSGETYSVVWVPGKTRVVGEREIEIVRTTYEKYIRLTAREAAPAAEGRPPNEIWTVDVTSEGESRDLRKMLPILVAATIDYIGKDSEGQQSIRIRDTDSDVVFVKNGMRLTSNASFRNL